jgi:hypothetical protein
MLHYNALFTPEGSCLESHEVSVFCAWFFCRPSSVTNFIECSLLPPVSPRHSYKFLNELVDSGYIAQLITVIMWLLVCLHKLTSFLCSSPSRSRFESKAKSPCGLHEPSNGEHKSCPLSRIKPEYFNLRLVTVLTEPACIVLQSLFTLFKALPYTFDDSWIAQALFLPQSRAESYVTTHGQSANRSWNKAPISGLRPDFYYCQRVVGLLMWGALSDERTGLSFTVAVVELASTVIRGSESRGTRDRILLCQIRDFPFCRLLRLAGLRWRCSTPPQNCSQPHAIVDGWQAQMFRGGGGGLRLHDIYIGCPIMMPMTE